MILHRNCTHTIYWLFGRLRILTVAYEFTLHWSYLLSNACELSASWRYRRQPPIPGEPQSNPERTKPFRACSSTNTGHRQKKNITQIITASCTLQQKRNRGVRGENIPADKGLGCACCGACLAALKADVGATSSKTDKGSRHALIAETSVSVAVVPPLRHLGSRATVIFNSRRLHATSFKEFMTDFSNWVKKGTWITLWQSECLIMVNQRICSALLRATPSQCNLLLL